MKKQQEIDSITLSYLNFQTPKENRGNIIVFFLIFLDLLGLFPILSEPFSSQYFWAAFIPVAFMHIWALLYIIAPYKFERTYYLFFGIYGIVNTYVFSLSIQKFLSNYILTNTVLPIIIGLFLFIGLIIIINWANLKLLRSGTYANLQKKGTKVNTSPIIAASGLGYILGQLILAFVYSDSLIIMVFIFVLSILSVVTAYFSVFIHRYIFIQKNEVAVKKLYPEFGLPKSERNSKYL
ncbi:hypothetical protein [Cytobacillus purgationiresistens]|uniref:Neutral ceramidase superfamily lipid hydrolase n=1 Tax=Cytobacillus purgationiresistens TaxID=863449 RepID=A0ABU0APW0_9BACI|nr:hypothetical protein [Cytobacillus purgationiresistens]MDQ0273324.1 putative neutral ceramidase superfamily lipid hydrolase [Cytobacillus purgationiresistens]